MSSILERRPTFNIVTGSNDTGKTALINHVLSNVVDQKKLFQIKLNFRDFQCLNSNELALKIKMAIPSNYKEKLTNLIPNIEEIVYQDLSVKFFEPKENKESLSDVLQSLKKSIPSFSIWKGKLLPVLYMDEVNAIEHLSMDETGENAIEHLLRWIVGVTKEDPKFHVIFGTSDSLFVHRIYDKVKAERAHVTTVGDLSADEAKSYFYFILQNFNDDDKEIITKNLNFEKDIYPFVGGRMFHIENAILEYLIYGTKGENMKLLERKIPMYKEALKAETGSSKENISFKKLVEWNEEEIRSYFKELSEKGYIVLDDNKLKKKKLLSMTKNNLLNYRATPPVTEDIKGLTKFHYPVFVAPSPADLYVIKKIVSDMRI